MWKDVILREKLFKVVSQSEHGEEPSWRRAEGGQTNQGDPREAVKAVTEAEGSKGQVTTMIEVA